MIDVPAPVVVFVHVYYPDIWRGMSALVAERLALPFHLVLTSPCPEHEIVVPRTPALLSSRFLATENRGRDILPFLRAVAETENFEFGLKLHTKKSPQRDDGEEWRSAVLDSLLPPPAGAGGIVARMRADRRVGFIAPGGFCLSVKPWVLLNEPGMHRIISLLGGDPTENTLDDVFFAAGSMFWFRRSALAALTDRKVMELFEPERGQFDGTIAHAMERLFPVEARRQGYVAMAVPALMSSHPEMPRTKLLELARRHADVPTRQFPGPDGFTAPLSEYWASLASSGPKPLAAALYRASLPVGLRRTLRRLLRR